MTDKIVGMPSAIKVIREIAQAIELFSQSVELVENSVELLDQELQAHALEESSTNKKGHVQLTSSLDSSSETLGATAHAVKILNDNINKVSYSFISVNQFSDEKTSTAIQLALDYAKSKGGGTVKAPSGTYSITSAIRIPSNTKLVGEGDVVLKRMAGTNAILLNDTDGVTGGYTANKNMVVENITFDANNTDFPEPVTSLAFGHCTNVTIDNCKFINCNTWHDVEINSCKNVLINNCDFANYSGTTESLQLDFLGSEVQFPWFGPYDNTSCEDVTINGCSFKYVGARRSLTAIGNHSFREGIALNNVKIKNCKFDNFLVGVSLNDSNNLYVDNNTFIDCIIGVNFEEKSTGSSNWNITNNYFKNVRSLHDDGIQYGDGRFFFGVPTTLTKPFDDIVIVNNIIDTALLHGIGGTFGKNLKITDNVITGCGRNAIFVYGANDVVVSGNIAYDNVKLGEVVRADIVIGNAPTTTNNVIVTGNNITTMILGLGITGVLVTNNIVKTSLKNDSASGATVKGNIIAGTYTA